MVPIYDQREDNSGVIAPYNIYRGLFISSTASWIGTDRRLL